MAHNSFKAVSCPIELEIEPPPELVEYNVLCVSNSSVFSQCHRIAAYSSTTSPLAQRRRGCADAGHSSVCENRVQNSDSSEEQPATNCQTA